ncbi:MAG: MFS transporter [Geodermatophilaceae bacterium]
MSETTMTGEECCPVGTPVRPEHSTAALAGLALCVLAVGTGEYAVAGMLPAVAFGLGTGVAAAGQLVTVYAVAVLLVGPVLTAVTARRSPKSLLLALMVLFCLATLGCAAAASFPVMVAARVLAGSVHCTVFAVALVTAVGLVPPERSARAIGAVATGLTLATVLGVPVGTVVAAQAGWRWTFVLIAAIGAAGLVMLAATLPRLARPTPGPVTAQVRSLLRPAVAVTFAMTILGYAGVFTAFTYLAPLVRDLAGGGPVAVTVVVTAFGAGGVAGNAVAARTTDTHLRGTLLTALAVMAAALLLLPAVAGSLPVLVADVALFGAAAFATVPGLQARVIGLATGAPTLAAATNVAAFNLANAIGAALGGAVVATAGVSWTGPAGAVVTIAGLALTAFVLRRRPERAGAAAPDGAAR